MLSEQQVAQFKDEGFLLLRGWLDPAEVARWREDYWAHIRDSHPSFDPDDESTWPTPADIRGGYSAPLGEHPKVVVVVEQLGAGKLASNGAGMNVRWPESSAAGGSSSSSPEQWKPPAQGHIDGYGPGGWSGGFSLAATTYLEDVEHAGGCFTYWPRSHKAVHQFFLRHPEQIDGSFYVREDWDSKGWRMMYEDPSLGDWDVGEATEFVGRVGDVIFWHNFLVHTGSSNMRRGAPRLGLFSRWHHAEMKQPTAIQPPDFEPLDSPRRSEELRYETPRDLWKMWSVQCRGVAAKL
jgi:hypothetical protein